MPNYTNIFNVYMRCEGGTAAVDTGMCIASISGQSMGASAAWDGRIDIEEIGWLTLTSVGDCKLNSETLLSLWALGAILMFAGFFYWSTEKA